ncbi:LicD family protein [Planktotalea arctica]|uniref:LicD family protein n=1 Tax=Planktotalea arctica TaxID=1481893 RepID=UPI00321C25F8
MDDLSDLHRVITMMALELDAHCKANGIAYYMMGGTALGAMRHKGFIPWDDDFDVFMDRPNYEKFLTSAPSSMDPDKYYIQRENTPEWPMFFSKLRLNKTEYLESDTMGRDQHQGIFIDVMCLNGAFSTIAFRKWQYRAARVLSAHALARRGYATNSLSKKIVMFVARYLCVGPIKAGLLRFVRGGRKRHKTPLVGHFFGRAPFKSTTFPRRYLGTPRYVPFEQTELPVPEEAEEYLTIRFGRRYMDPPSEVVKASFPSHAVRYDVGGW